MDRSYPERVNPGRSHDTNGAQLTTYYPPSKHNRRFTTTVSEKLEEAASRVVAEQQDRLYQRSGHSFHRGNSRPYRPCAELLEYIYSEQIPEKDPYAYDNRYTVLTNMERLRPGAMANCRACLLVLDGITTFNIAEWDLEDFSISVVARYSGPELRMEIELLPGPEGRRPIDGPFAETTLEIFRAEGRDERYEFIRSPPAICVRSLPSEETSSEETCQTLDRWVTDCVENHASCAKATEYSLPKRVMEITPAHFYIRENLVTKAKYACLSWCWGKGVPALKLDRDTSPLLKQGQHLSHLPQTFLDAAHVCLSLGIRFLWIDAMCIKQDDDEDWKEAAATMADIYENAYLTIAATWCENSNVGLFSPKGNRYNARRLWSSGLHVRETPPRFPMSIHDRLRLKSFKAWPLLQRAWVYQERRLSPRIVHYGEHQIYWECKSTFLSEDRSTSKPAELGLEGLIALMDFNASPKSPVDAWRKIVTEYTKMKLTYETDRLAAIAAVVEREMRNRPSDVYIAGMWKSSLLEDLAWSTVGETCNYSRSPVSAPTWSWASSHVPVAWSSGDVLSTLQLKDVTFTPVGPSHLGQVRNASISLEGPTFTAMFSRVPYNNTPTLRDQWTITETSKFVKHVKVDWQTAPDFDYNLGEQPVRPGDAVTVILHKSLLVWPGYAGIVLRKVTYTEFERIGYMEIIHRAFGIESTVNEEVEEYRKFMDEFVDSLPIREVTII